jgi:hypothetical protein
MSLRRALSARLICRGYTDVVAARRTKLVPVKIRERKE